MQEEVVLLVLAYHQWSVVSLRAIRVMNDGAFWQLMPERFFRSYNMKPLQVAARIDDLTIHNYVLVSHQLMIPQSITASPPHTQE